MTVITCADVRRGAAEYALGILPEGEATLLESHLHGCDECRREVLSLSDLGSGLLDLVPDHEPPLGFDQNVVSRMGTARTSRRRLGRRAYLVPLLAAAAAAGIVGGIVASSGSHRNPAHEVEAVFESGGHEVGTVYSYGSPPWVSMDIRGAAVSGPIQCQLRRSDGSFVTVGSFELIHGDGAWSAPEPHSVGHPTGARLLSAGGEVVAVASFGSSSAAR